MPHESRDPASSISASLHSEFAQVVVGAALPIGLTSDSSDWRLFFYCSFEHSFIKKAE
jgi:hypothetical protein